MAKKFVFRLEVVRRTREQARDAQRRVVAVQVRAVAKVEDRIRELSDQSAAALEVLAKIQRTGVLDTLMIRQQHAHRVDLNRSMQQQRVELAHKRAELLKEQERLAEASKQLKAIEKLRDKKIKQHQEQVAREEQAFSDEVSIQMYLRRQGETVHEVLT